MSDFYAIPYTPPESDVEAHALRREWDALSPKAKAARLRGMIENRDMESYGKLLAVLYVPNPNPEVGRRLVAEELARKGNWALLALLTREWLPADQEPFDPHARVLADLYELKGVWKDPIRAMLLESVIKEVDARWERPENYRDMTFE